MKKKVTVYDIEGKAYHSLLIGGIPIIETKIISDFPIFNFQVKIIDDGNTYWRLGDAFNRLDGPAIEFSNGSCFWHVAGVLHREDGPAIEHSNGKREWFFHNRQLTESEFKKKIRSSNIKSLD